MVYDVPLVSPVTTTGDAAVAADVYPESGVNE
jgi:hypothetical protein